MSIKIYSGYDEFKYEEPQISEYLEDENCSEDEEESEDESDDLFFVSKKGLDFVDSSTFYVVSDMEDEENAEDISGYLGKFKRMYLPDFHKIVFCVS
jgi:hypothetical protein